MAAKGCLALRPRARQSTSDMEPPGRLLLPAKAREQYAPVKRRRCLLLLAPLPRVQARPAVGPGSHQAEQQRQRRLRDRPGRTRGLRDVPTPRSDGSHQNWVLAGEPGHSLNG
jgi:hypothetical protein